MNFVDVVLPLPLASSFTYSVNEEDMQKMHLGTRVIVPFGARKMYTAFVVRMHHDEPTAYKVKAVMEILDEHAILLPRQMQFFQWLARYYLATLGDVYKAALPSGLKLESETQVMLGDGFVESNLTPHEQLLCHFLEGKGPLSVAQLEKLMPLQNVRPLVHKLIARECVEVSDEIKRTYKPKMEVRLRLPRNLFSERRLHLEFFNLKRALKQEKTFACFMEMAHVVEAIEKESYEAMHEVSRQALADAAGVPLSVCNALVNKKLLEAYEVPIERVISPAVSTRVAMKPLNAMQSGALTRLQEMMQQHAVNLLYGVTSSGKTEVYIHLIQSVMAQGKQILYLVPEIALTTQLTNRLAHVFGDKLAVYHSKFQDAQRVEIWNKQLSQQPYSIILGARSAVFLPFQNLGLVIVDEEHDSSYKQQDPAPRYHAKNAAIMLARLYGAKTILGTATPAVETFYNVHAGKYGMVKMSERYGNVQLPEIKVVDIQEERRKKLMNGVFSRPLLQAVTDALSSHEQVILFQNRRGFSPVVVCHTCGWVPRCIHCDVSLTYHRSQGKMTCHYCGYTCDVPVRCPACGETEFKDHGAGTEKIEEEVKLYFPQARVARMDLDTTRSRRKYEMLLADFQQHRTDVLIGTQMITKGLDFAHVGVVGILDADLMLNLPDFRSHEQSFQLMSQVAGRAGRRSTQGRVVLQTKNPELPVINHIVHHDYDSFYAEQIQERDAFMFPPFCRLIYVFMKHKEEQLLSVLAQEMFAQVSRAFGPRALGPDAPPVARVQALFIRKIMIKVGPNDSMQKVGSYLLQLRDAFLASPAYRSAQIYFDVDPV